MGFISRMLKRIGATSSPRHTVRHGTRSLAIEPLEDRRMLRTAPDGFSAFHVKDPSGNYTQLRFVWEDNGDEAGYEIERSITRYDDAEHPNLWGGGFTSKLLQNQPELEYKASFRRYYFRIRSTGHPGSPSNSDWSEPIVALPKPPDDPNDPDLDIVLPEDKTIKVSAVAIPGAAPKIMLQWPEELAYEDADYKIYRKEKDALSFEGFPYTSQIPDVPLATLDFDDPTRPNYEEDP